MAFAKNSMLFFMVMALFGVCFGTVYKVGDSNGWTDKGSVSYKDWASSKTFVVGDTIGKCFSPYFFMLYGFSMLYN